MRNGGLRGADGDPGPVFEWYQLLRSCWEYIRSQPAELPDFPVMTARKPSSLCHQIQRHGYGRNSRNAKTMANMKGVASTVTKKLQKFSK